MEQFDSQEITEWMAYEDVEGLLGERRADYLAGVIASSGINLWRGQDTDPVEPLDVIQDWGGQRQRAKEAKQDEQRRHDLEGWQRFAEKHRGDG